MKKNAALLFLLLPCFLAAQTVMENRFGITANLNTVGVIASNGLGNLSFDNGQLADGGGARDRSFNLGLNLSWLAAPSWGFRLKITTTRWNYFDYRDLLDQQPNNAPYDRIDDIHVTSTDYSFAPGIFYQLRVNKIAFFGGLDAEFTLHNKEIYSDYVTQDDPNPVNAYKIHNIIAVPGGYSFGIGAFTGANWYFTPHMAAGLELSTAFLYTSIGNHTYYYTTPISGTYYQASTSWYAESINSFQLGQLKGSLNISYYF